MQAGVVDGLIAGTVVALLVATVKHVYSGVVFIVALALALLLYSKHKLIVPLVVAGAVGVGRIAVAMS